MVNEMYKELNARLDILDSMRMSNRYGILELLESTAVVIQKTLEVLNNSVDYTRIDSD